MEVKKSKKAEIESKRATWLLIGFVSVLACMFVTFEWTQRDKDINLNVRAMEPIFTQDLIPITFPDKPTPPPPPKPTITEVINIIDDESNIEQTNIETTEDIKDVGVAIKIIDQPVIEEVDNSNDVFMIVEEMPHFPGGDAELMQYFRKNVKYPTIAQENGVQGQVIVQFIIDKDGTITDPVVVRSRDPHLDKEALRVIMAMPKWKPGMQRGKAVRVKYTVPVTFKLQ